MMVISILCISLISLASYQSCKYNHVYTVVTFGFHQRQYMFLEGIGDATEVCVDRNGSTALPVTVTVDGSEFWTISVLLMPSTCSHKLKVLSILFIVP